MESSELRSRSGIPLTGFPGSKFTKLEEIHAQRPGAGSRFLLLTLAEFLHLLSQAGVAANQAAEIGSVNHPSSDVGGVKVFDGVHSRLRFGGTVDFAGTSPDPSKDSRA